MHSELKDRTYTSDDTPFDNDMYDDDLYYDDDIVPASDRSRVVRLLVITVIMLVLILVILYGVVPVVSEWMQPDLPPLAPAVQT